MPDVPRGEAEAERRRVEAALRTSEARFRSVADSGVVALAFFDAHGAITDANAAFLELVGYSRAELLAGAVRWDRLTPPEWLARTREAVESFRRTGRIAPYEKEYFRRDGARFWGLFAGGRIEGTDEGVAVVLDITERKRAEAALRESERRHRLIVEGARDYAILSTDLEGRITSWSPGAEAVFGWPAAEAVGQAVDMTFVPEDRAAGVPAAERAAAAVRETAPDVRWHQRRDGTRVFIEGMMRALHDESGTVRGFVKVGQDVTQRRRLDTALRASEARYRELVENVRDYAIFLLDAYGAVTEWPTGAQRIMGYSAEEAVGRYLGLFYTPEDMDAGVPARHLAEAAATGRSEWEGWRVRRDGTRFWATEIATAVHDADGHPLGFTMISRDLTERRASAAAAEQAQLITARDELRRALAAAEEAERQRLARELHDQLGQQLTAFRLGLEDAARLAAAQVPADAAPDASPLLARLAQLAALADRMTAGARYVALELRPPELDDVGFESALASYVTQWGARYGVATEFEVVGSGRARALATEVGSTLYRIAQEALTNVAKHAGASLVSVIVEKLGGEVRVIVEDDGRGFDVAAMGSLPHAARRLGLAGMRERAALVGGTVAVESSPGVGTTVYVWLPLAEPAPGAGGA